VNRESVLAINVSRVVHETIDGETILLNLETGNYFSLDATGAVVWQLLQNTNIAAEIIDFFQKGRGAQAEEIEIAIISFITELVKEELIVEKDGGDSQNDFPESANNRDLIKQYLKTAPFTPPVLNKYTDMQELLQLDPIHDVEETTGWPAAKISE
jgi:hypothetical protein